MRRMREGWRQHWSGGGEPGSARQATDVRSLLLFCPLTEEVARHPVILALHLGGSEEGRCRQHGQAARDHQFRQLALAARKQTRQLPLLSGLARAPHPQMHTHSWKSESSRLTSKSKKKALAS